MKVNATLGFEQEITFIVEGGNQDKVVTWKVLSDEKQPKLVETVERVVGVLAPKVMRRLENGEEVSWTENVFLSRSGLRYRGPGQSTWSTLPFRQIRQWECQPDKVVVYVPEIEEPTLTISKNDLGFYPGYRAFEILMDTQGARRNLSHSQPAREIAPASRQTVASSDYAVSPGFRRKAGFKKLMGGLAMFALCGAWLWFAFTFLSEHIAMKTIVPIGLGLVVIGLGGVSLGSLELLLGKPWASIPQGWRILFLIVIVPIVLLGLPMLLAQILMRLDQ